MHTLPFDLIQRARKHPLHIQQRTLRAADGRRMVLVMLSNNYRADGAHIKALEDRVTQALLQ